jgi:hypothetical protein
MKISSFLLSPFRSLETPVFLRIFAAGFGAFAGSMLTNLFVPQANHFIRVAILCVCIWMMTAIAISVWRRDPSNSMKSKQQMEEGSYPNGVDEK